MSSDSNMKEQIRNTFSDHHAEIKRRSEICEQNDNNDKTFSKVSDAELYTFVNPDQKFIVFSLSHEKFYPQPENANNPAICIYGAFINREEAVEYAHYVNSCHPGISVLVDETHKWIVAAKNVENLQDKTFLENHTKRLLDDHLQKIDTNLKDFEKKKTGQKNG